MVKKIVRTKFNLCCKGGDPKIYKNSIFPAYVTEKNKIITPWLNIIFILLNVQNDTHGCL